MSTSTLGATDMPESNRRIVTVALLLAMAVCALEQTVVSTAMASIIAQLKGLDIYPWVFSGYLLASTVTTPLYGKLADRWGRKPILMFGLALFTLGSILSGQSRSMGMLIAMRVIQGLGAGAVGPIVLTIMGDMFTIQERARVQSFFSMVWGVSSLAGPTLGGELTDRLSWRWVFYISVPFGLAAMFILQRYVKEPPVKEKKTTPIDWLGALLLAGGTSALLLSVLEGPGASAGRVIGWMTAAVVLIVSFVMHERRVTDPMLSIELLTRKPILAAMIGSFMIGGLLFGLDTYIPPYIQGVLGTRAAVAGRVLTPLFLAWAISVFLAANVVARLGFRRTSVFGSCLITIGTAGLAVATMFPAWAKTIFVGSMLVIGFGMGPTSLSQFLSVQAVVDWSRRGAATAAVTFFRTIGGALCVGLLGASLSLELGVRLKAGGAEGVDVAAALRPETHEKLSPSDLAVVREGLAHSLRHVYLEMVVLAAVAIAASRALPDGRAVAKQTPEEASETELLAMEI